MNISTDTRHDFSTPKTTSALAIFCRAPRLGTVKTRLAATWGDVFALELYTAMLRDSFAMGNALEPEVVTFSCFTPHDGFEGENSLSPLWDGAKLTQGDGDLGDKMLDAFCQLRSQGFTEIILIGSDSPDLPISYLRDALDVLKAAPGLVFGPARDGGFTLIGASVEVPPELFRGVQWSHSETLEAIRRRNEASWELRWSELPIWQDVDDADDLFELRRRLFEHGTHAPHTRQFLEESQAEILKAQDD